MASSAAGKPRGYGPGRFISREKLVRLHGLLAHRLPSGSATLNFPEVDVLPEGSNPRANPTGLLSQDERKSALTSERDAKQIKIDGRAALDAVAALAKSAGFSAKRTPCPRSCGALFRSPVHLENHVRSNCGQYAKAVERRAQHDARTIRARHEAYDGDLASEAERLEEEGLDLFTVVFQPSAIEYGWTVGVALDADDGTPVMHAGLVWSCLLMPLLCVLALSCVSPQSTTRRWRVIFLGFCGGHNISMEKSSRKLPCADRRADNSILSTSMTIPTCSW